MTLRTRVSNTVIKTGFSFYKNKDFERVLCETISDDDYRKVSAMQTRIKVVIDDHICNIIILKVFLKNLEGF